jgi:hypothetical protein
MKQSNVIVIWFVAFLVALLSFSSALFLAIVSCIFSKA